MKGAGWIVILLGLLGVTYLLTRDLQTMKGDRGGKVAIEPLLGAREAAQKVMDTRKRTADEVEKADR